MSTLRFAVITFMTCAPLSVYAQQQSSQNQSNARAATAEISPFAGSDVKGAVRFEDAGEHLRVRAEVTGLSKGKHGFHIHEGSSCDNPGEHFRPRKGMHGAPTNPGTSRHLGDLGNLTANEQGRARYESIDPRLSLEDPHSIVGKVVVVHRGEDDYLSQPSGDSGDPVACGLIKAVG